MDAETLWRASALVRFNQLWAEVGSQIEMLDELECEKRAVVQTREMYPGEHEQEYDRIEEQRREAIMTVGNWTEFYCIDFSPVKEWW